MKPYDIDRKSHQTCRYGCCTSPKGSKKHLATRRRQKRSSRAYGHQEIRETTAEIPTPIV